MELKELYEKVKLILEQQSPSFATEYVIIDDDGTIGGYEKSYEGYGDTEFIDPEMLDWSDEQIIAYFQAIRAEEEKRKAAQEIADKERKNKERRQLYLMLKQEFEDLPSPMPE